MKHLALIFLLIFSACAALPAPQASRGIHYSIGGGGGGGGGSLTLTPSAPLFGGGTGSSLSIGAYSLFTYPETYGGVPDEKIYYNGSMNNGSGTLTDSIDSPFLPTDCHSGSGCTGLVSKIICVSDTSGTYGPSASGSGFSLVGQSEKCGTITSYISSSSVGLSFTSANGGNITGQPFRYGTDNCVALQAALTALQPNGGKLALDGPYAKSCSIAVPSNASVMIEGTSSYSQDSNISNSHPASLGNVSGLYDETVSETVPALLIGAMPITSISGNGSTVTIILSQPSIGVGTSQTITIAGASVSGYNGTHTSVTVSGSTITYSGATTGASTGGVLVPYNGAGVQNVQYAFRDFVMVGGVGSGQSCTAGSGHCSTGYFGTLAGGGSSGVGMIGEQNVLFDNVDVTNYLGDCYNAQGTNNQALTVENSYNQYCGGRCINIGPGNSTTYTAQDVIYNTGCFSMGLGGLFYHPPSTSEYGDTIEVNKSTMAWNDQTSAGGGADTGTADIELYGGRDKLVIATWMESDNSGTAVDCVDSGGSNSSGAGSDLWIGNHYDTGNCDRVQMIPYAAAGVAVPSCNTANNATELWASDVTSCSYGTTYVSGGSSECKLGCNGTNWVAGY